MLVIYERIRWRTHEHKTVSHSMLSEFKSIKKIYNKLLRKKNST